MIDRMHRTFVRCIAVSVAALSFTVALSAQTTGMARAPEHKTDSVVHMRFFAGGPDVAPGGSRIYANRFESETTWYVHYEVEFANPFGPPPTTVHAWHSDMHGYQVESVWFGPGGKVIHKKTVKQWFSENNDRWRASHGFGGMSAGSLAPGMYRVEISVRGRRVADGSFEVFQGRAGSEIKTATVEIYSSLKPRDIPDFLVNGEPILFSITSKGKSGFAEVSVPNGRVLVLPGNYSFPKLDRLDECKGLNLYRIEVWGLSGEEERTRLEHCTSALIGSIMTTSTALLNNTPTEDVIQLCGLHVVGSSGNTVYYSKQEVASCQNTLTSDHDILSDIDPQTGYLRSVPRVDFVAEAGKTYYLRYSATKAGLKLEIVDATTAVAETSKLRHFD